MLFFNTPCKRLSISLLTPLPWERGRGEAVQKRGVGVRSKRERGWG
jgi:hypothetical protein